LSDPFQAIIPGGLPLQSPFSAGSRYSGLPLATLDVDGQLVPYVTRRFLPQPERLALLREHVVTDGERPDTVTAAHLGDPEQFWQVCDANRVMRPQELTEEVGRRLRITLPEGIPGLPDA
jgi:hypothetical protein